MKKHLFLSAHLDDAVLSCGGFIYKLTQIGSEVLISTVFSGSVQPESLSPLAKWFHGICDLGDNAMDIRRTEDKNAAQYLGVDLLHIDMLECLYRRDANRFARYIKENEIYQGDLNREIDTLNEVILALLNTIDFEKFSEIYIPLGIGRHIDHLLLRKATELIFCRESNQNFPKLYYYEDIPYVFWDRDPNWRIDLTKDLRPILQFMDRNAWKAKIEAILLYKSLVRMFWENENKMENQLAEYALAVGVVKPGERFWVSKDSSTPHEDSSEEADVTLLNSCLLTIS